MSGSAVRRSPRLRDVRVRPTRLGAGLAVLVVLLWLVGLNYQVNLAYVVAFWLAGFLLVAVLLNCLQLIGLRLDITPPAEVFQGQQAEVLLTPAAETKPRYRKLWFAAADAQERQASDYQPAEFAAKQPRPFIWGIQAERRGVLHLPPLHCATVFPFGVSSAECVWHWPDEGLVYPAPLPHTPPQGTTPDEDGEPRLRLGMEDLAYLQDHQPGASLRHIAWKTYAKSGRLLDKRFEEPAFAVSEHIISYADYPAGTSADRLAGLLCHRVLEAHKHGRPYTLILPGQTIPPRHGQREQCLTALALL